MNDIDVKNIFRSKLLFVTMYKKYGSVPFIKLEAFNEYGLLIYLRTVKMDSIIRVEVVANNKNGFISVNFLLKGNNPNCVLNVIEYHPDITRNIIYTTLQSFVDVILLERTKPKLLGVSCE